MVQSMLICQISLSKNILADGLAKAMGAIGHIAGCELRHSSISSLRTDISLGSNKLIPSC